MNRKNTFESFLNQLKTIDNKVLIETIEKGFNTIIESYADVREEKVNPLSEFNQMASNTAHLMGNDVLNFLQQSSERNAHLFSVDENPELDTIPTSEYRQFSDPDVVLKPKDEIEDDLGLTAGDLLELNF